MITESPVSIELDGDVAWVTIDNPPVNATSAAVRAGLLDAVAAVREARVAILICAGRTFVAGGDMSEFDKPPVEPHLPDVVQAIEDSETPFIAAMHGTVLGGGLEIALACAWRLAEAGTRFGLPEVNVGLIPGAGGSQRAPRLLGMDLAVDLACRGKLVTTTRLLDIGALDGVAETDLGTAARQFANDLPPRPTPVSERTVRSSSADDLAAIKADLTRRAKGQMSPLANLEALQWSLLPFSEGQPKERERHLEMRASSESKALRYAFFAERAVARPDATASGKVGDLASVVIVGGGLMGTGIATALLAGGFQVTIVERGHDEAAQARDRTIKLVAGTLKRGKISKQAYENQVARLSTTHACDTLSNVSLAIEAVFEDADVKREVFAELIKVVDDRTILATNTSYIDPTEIFAETPGHERCLGLHFFSPAHIMKLLEVVRMPETSADTLATCFRLGQRLCKVPVLSGICDGFIGNRMLAAYRREAEYLLADGALPRDVDAAMRAVGMPMGPFEMQDFTGLRISWANRRRQAPTRDPNQRHVTIFDQLYELGRLGQSAGKGWYRYADGSRTPEDDPEVERIILDYAVDQGLTRKPYSASDISDRLLAVLANEGARIVEEGIAERSTDVDMVQIHGYGFPRWVGGPMHRADDVGWDRVAATMARVAEESPGSWTLAERLRIV